MSSEPPKSCIENLPNELWVRIFTHIDWMNLLLAFYGLNKRINQLFLSTDVLSIYSSCLINRHDSIYLYFKEFPIKNFQYLRHLQLIYDNEFDESLNITKQLTSFSNLISLTVEANCGEYGGSNEFQVFILRQTFPCLQQLCLRGNVFGHDIGLSYAEFKSNFPSLRYLELDKLHVNFALQIFDDYPQLRSFSAKLYCNMTTDTIKSFDTFLPALKVLKLRGDFDFGNEFGTQFLERFFSCCSNIHTFILEAHCGPDWSRLFQEDWWPHALVSNTKLQKIALHFKWITRTNFHNWSAEIDRFRSSQFFTQLNTTIRTDFSSEFMRRMTVDVFIKN